MDDFASTALFNLIATELQKQGFDVKPSRQFGGKTARINKASLLDAALDDLGPSALLKVGVGIDAIRSSPMVAVLLKAVTVPDLIDRWQRLEVYFHGNHRVRSLNFTDTSATLSHYALKGDGPNESEDLVIAGLFAALFNRIGVRGLSLHLGGTAAISKDEILDATPRSKDTRVWHYGWSKFEKGEVEKLTLDTKFETDQQLCELLTADIGRSWKLATVAGMMNVSTRTLQRQLALCDTNFQSMLRSTRADCAAMMLLDSQYALPEIGYAAGFSDQAHFNREFKLRFNMAPKDYLSLNS